MGPSSQSQICSVRLPGELIPTGFSEMNNKRIFVLKHPNLLLLLSSISWHHTIFLKHSKRLILQPRHYLISQILLNTRCHCWLIALTLLMLRLHDSPNHLWNHENKFISFKTNLWVLWNHYLRHQWKVLYQRSPKPITCARMEYTHQLHDVWQEFWFNWDAHRLWLERLLIVFFIQLVCLESVIRLSNMQFLKEVLQLIFS